MTTRRREITCEANGCRTTLDEACCPVCTRPLETVDGATHARYGYGEHEARALAACAHCPTDSQDQAAAFEITWQDRPLDRQLDGYDAHREETARIIGVFTADGELLRDLAAVDSDVFRVCWHDLASRQHAL